MLDPENPVIHWSLGYTYALLGRIADARVRMQWMQAQAPQMPYTVQLTATAAQRGQKRAVHRNVVVRVEPAFARLLEQAKRGWSVAGVQSVKYRDGRLRMSWLGGRDSKL